MIVFRQLWFLVLCVLLGVFAPSRADARLAETRTWGFAQEVAETRLETEPQAVGTHQENGLWNYEHAPGCTQAAESVPGKFTVGIYDDIRGTVPGLDAHHVGQKAVMGKLIPGYDPATAPSILVPKVGHTIRGPNGIVSRSTEGLTSARDVIARDIMELRRVYPDVPNSKLQELIQLNKDLYPAFRK